MFCHPYAREATAGEIPQLGARGYEIVRPAVRKTSAPMVPAHLRLLVIDDDPLLLQSLRDTLESEGHFVTVAEGGQSGIDTFATAQAKGAPSDVVITDLGMPHLDGRAVAAAVKAISPETPVVLLTGWGHRLIEEREIPSGVDRVMSKPPKLRELRVALAELAAPSKPSTV